MEISIVNINSDFQIDAVNKKEENFELSFENIPAVSYWALDALAGAINTTACIYVYNIVCIHVYNRSEKYLKTPLSMSTLTGSVE